MLWAALARNIPATAESMAQMPEDIDWPYSPWPPAKLTTCNADHLQR